MKRCSYCGKDYSDDAVACPTDGMALEESIPPSIPPLPATSQASGNFIPNERQLRLIEVVLVCTIALGRSLLISILTLFGGSLPHFAGAMQWGYGIFGELASLALLWYILLRRSKSFSDLGFVWRWTDIGWSLLLCVGGYIAYCIVYTAAYYSNFIIHGHPATRSSISDYFYGGGIGVGTIIFLCINPFFEELIVRAYLMTEAKQLTNSVALAVIISTLFQMSYHLYQGVPLALAVSANFFIWALYYAKTNRITPIILAHLYCDLGSTLVYLARH